MDNIALNALVAKVIAGDQEALNTLIERSYQDLFYYALTIVKNEDKAYEALQNGCEEIIKTIGNLRESAAFVTWSRCIIYHHCLKLVGKSRIVTLEANEDGETILDLIPDETPGTLPQEVVENKELHDILQTMLDSLPDNQRAALMLYHYEHLPVKTIAAIQGEKESTVKTHLHRGRQALAKKVEEYEKKTGTKLHCVGVLPLLYFLFRNDKAKADIAVAARWPQLQAALAPAAAAAGVGGAVAAAASSSLAIKVTAIVAAAALVIGGVVIGIQSGSQPTEEENPGISYSEPSAPAPTDPGPGEPHSFYHYAFDDEAHWLLCDCPGATSTRQEHTFVDGQCTVCHMPQPLPGGNSLLTFDTRVLGGHWLLVDQGNGNPTADFYIEGDGSLYMNGNSYYPIGSLTNTYNDGTVTYDLYFRETPYDPSVGVTMDEMFTAPLSLTLTPTDGKYLINMYLMGSEEDYSSGNYYRESDYAGYQVIELTLENYLDYLTITLDPVTCTYYSSVGFSAYQSITCTLREDLGFASWVHIEGTASTQKHHLKSNIATGVNEVTYVSSSVEELPCRLDFIGYSGDTTRTILSRDTVPINNIVEWYGMVTTDITIESITGRVLVPIQ